ncbi:DUF4349 domain-containing protein, partial [Candidatus Jorgensenbacteria bacterium]|nr:DUF4349 domain-containing protein [Candidatus Jorgensenbacteria bacterium]
VDLEAQIKNLRLEEGQYQAIMQRSGTIPDTLQVAQRLSDVRGRIERLQGQIQYLSRQVDMSTISVSLTAEADVEVFGIRWRPLFVIKQAFRDALSGVTGYIDWLVRFVLRLPVVALWLATIIAGVIIAWRLLRWVWFRFFGKKSGTV